MKRFIPVVFVLGTCGALAPVPACNNQPLAQDVTNAFTTISGCVVSSIESGALSDPVMIAAQCGGIVIQQVIAIIENEIARRKSDAAVGVDPGLLKLEAVLAKAKSL